MSQVFVDTNIVLLVLII